ncbi:MAG TPA: phage terminase small subunit P27 family, partial [Phycisphaerae bacterium]|nr:phage terminase small subunit P27 family [Phycisphaerae bacterium]
LRVFIDRIEGAQMKGRKPEPEAVKAMKGITRRDRRNPSAPHFSPEICAPDWLDATARNEWQSCVDELSAVGLLTRVDAAALGAYCQSVSMLRAAIRSIKARGQVVTTKRGPMRNPSVGIALEAMRVIRSFASEFGFTPSARTRVRADQTHRDELADFLDKPGAVKPEVNSAGA